MNSHENKIKNFIKNQGGYLPNSIPGDAENEEILISKDGLYERREIINKRLMTRDGKQLLKEQIYETL